MGGLKSMKQAMNTPANNNTSPEIRAFIYQQLTDLEGLLPKGSNVNIVVDDPATLNKSLKKSKTYKKKVMIQLETEAGNLVVESEHKDVYKAIQIAKENLRAQLSALQSFLSDVDDRDQMIDDIITHKVIH